MGACDIFIKPGVGSVRGFIQLCGTSWHFSFKRVGSVWGSALGDEDANLHV